VSLLRKGTIQRRGGLPTPVMVDYFDVTSNASWGLWAVHPTASGISAIGQSIMLTTTRKLTNVKFSIIPHYAGLPEGTLVAALYEATGTHGVNAKPKGEDPLAISNPLNIENLTDGFNEFTFSGSQRYRMVEGLLYCIVVQVQSAIVLNGDNYPSVRSRSGGTHPGNLCGYQNGAWGTSSGYDTLFYLYGV